MLVCDGSNGAGKTTVITGLEAHLKQRGIEVVMTREPGGTEISEKIREIILDPSPRNGRHDGAYVVWGCACSARS
ncbi:hypothetical protein [Pseudoalteromonas maricaloris]|uniref:hypothetical protein n=1 Tax=Pseudoalteromonas maricaloris TaxID=184924 RepID=UPI003C1B94FE